MLSEAVSRAFRPSVAANMPIYAVTTFARASLGIITLPAEMLFRPSFGTRYFHPVILFLGFTLAYFMVYAPALITIPRYQGEYAFIPELYLKYMWLASLYHIGRLAYRFARPLTEEDSEWEYEVILPLRIIPFAKNWMVCRLIYEPLTVIIFTIFLMGAVTLPPLFANYLMGMGFSLFVKAWLTYYEAWDSMRTKLDHTYRAYLMQQITEDFTGSLGRYPVAPVGLAKPEDRNDLLAHVARVAE